MATESRDAEQYFADLYRLAIADDLTLEEKIDRAIAVGCERLGVENGVLSYTGDGDYEVVESTIGEGVYAPGGRSDLDTTWCRHVTESRESLGFADVSESAYADDVAREATGLACYIGAPVVVDNETYGTLCFSGDDPRETAFTETERRFVRLLARWVSYELERDRHHRELREQNERLDEFVGIVAHDLRNPISTVRGYADLALESAEGEQAEHLERIRRAAERMEGLVTDLLALARDGGGVGEREPVELTAVARDAWAFFESDDAELRLETDATVYANRSRLQQLFENAFRNAVEHGGPSVTVTVRDVDGGFAIEDDGPGLPAEIARTLFTSGSERTERIGLGLSIIERVVGGHEWDATVRSDDGGTVLEFVGVERVPAG
ncbi:GAF domain-containing sensor histidine kinase [Halobaculum sp. CBA1158]|uniref:sensor histidine kinase n=1 Tax=Halobaculum sp. CBA1158 TaxID=2904243 RepID=UPI001F1DDFE7|nr:GAF domain-containing sensor histidine kinase [Halobaculum sp. CBA1158]UIO99357.1 GAF domain-containing sensor histidine kinase [Halobaculum sp. CBA1158]